MAQRNKLQQALDAQAILARRINSLFLGFSLDFLTIRKKQNIASTRIKVQLKLNCIFYFCFSIHISSVSHMSCVLKNQKPKGRNVYFVRFGFMMTPPIFALMHLSV